MSKKKSHFLPPSQENVQAFKNGFEQQLVRGRILRSLYIWLHSKLFCGRCENSPRAVNEQWNETTRPLVKVGEQRCVGFTQSSPEMLPGVWEAASKRPLMQPQTGEGRLNREFCLNIDKHAGKVKCPGKLRRSLSCLYGVFEVFLR